MRSDPDALFRGHHPQSQARFSQAIDASTRWMAAPTRCGFVRRFEDEVMEMAFLDEYRSGGMRSMRLALLAAAGVFVAFALIAWFRGHETGSAFLIRASAISMLGLFASVLWALPVQVLRHYVRLVSALSVLSLIGVAGSAALAEGTLLVDAASPIDLIALVIIFAFMRLPGGVTLVLGLVWTGYGHLNSHLLTNLPDAELRSAVYRLFTVFLGFILLTSVERRERRLFLERNISEIARRELAEMTVKIKAASQEKSRLLAAIGHDLRQPLFAASLHLGLATDLASIDPTNRVLGEIRSARSALVVLETMMSDLLASVRGDFVAGALQLRPIPLDPLIADVVALAKPQAQEYNLSIRSVCSRRDVVVLSHETALRRVLVNLLANALKYGYPAHGGPGTVLIRVVMLRSHCDIHVIDRGPGIASGSDPELWQPFAQGPSSVPSSDDPLPSGGVSTAPDVATMSSANVGLGLYLVRRTIDSMEDHTLRVASRLGHGTRFTIRVPLADTAALCRRRADDASDAAAERACRT